MSTLMEPGIQQLHRAVFELGLLDRKTALKLWHVTAPFIRAALEHSQNEVTEHQLFARIMANKAQLWAVYETEKRRIVGAATTELITYPNLLSFRIITLGGERMSAWQSLLDAKLMDYAKWLGASRIEFVGRQGFVRALAGLGFRQAYVIATKAVNQITGIGQTKPAGMEDLHE